LLGFFIHIILIIHFIWAICRPHAPRLKDGAIDNPSDIRVFWEYLHKYIGRGLVLTAFVEIPLGLCKYASAEITQLGTCLANDMIRPYLILHFVYVGLYIIFIVFKEIKCATKTYERISG